MISDRDLVLAAAATYNPTVLPFYQGEDGAVRIFSVMVNGLHVISIEGTHDPVGWLIDFFAIRATDQEGIDHPSLGFLHAGFYAEAMKALPEVASALSDQPYAICGHSLGAALALLLGGLLIDRARPPVKIGAFAPPRVGGVDFVKVIASVPFCAYRFGNDPVPEVPFTFEPDLPYRQVALTPVGAPLTNPFAAHAIGNYVNAVS